MAAVEPPVVTSLAAVMKDHQRVANNCCDPAAGRMVFHASALSAREIGSSAQRRFTKLATSPSI